MSSPNILRSAVKQVTLGGRSVVSLRNLSTRSRRNFSSSQAPIAESGGSYSDLFGSSLLIGFSVVACYESIQMLEYGRTMRRSLDELAGRVSKTPMRDFLIGMWRTHSRK